MYLWLVLVLAAVLLWAWRSTKRPAWSPHGPPLVPWVGNLLSVDLKHAHHTYAAWAKMYGDIYYVKMGVLHQVVISDPDLIREAFSRPELSSRPDTEFFKFVVRGKGLISSQGELWQKSKLLTLHHLRNLGMGKSELEEYMHYQITSYMDEILAPNCGSELAFDSSLNVAVVNIIWKLVASEELSFTDTTVLNTINKLSEGTDIALRLEILDAVPWLSNVLASFVFNRAKVEKEFDNLLEDAFMPSIKQHRDDLDVSSEPRDYMEAMLQEQRKRPDLLTDWHLVILVMDLFLAGNDTTAATLRWAFCFLCNRPEVQRRLQAELDGQVGRQRLPSLSDRSRLPYVEAVLLETQRLADITPLLVMHQSMAPVDVGRYRLPAGVQRASVPEPLQFRPERFLDADGKFQPDKNVMPFSVGKRRCPAVGLEVNQATGLESTRPDLLTDWHLLISVMDLFLAGNDTTATTLRWAFCFLCSRSEVQRRLQAELDGQVGRQRLPSLSDRSRLPYVEAVLLETQRLADIAPLLLMHQSMAPVDVGRYRLPPGVQIIANVHSVHHSERLFPEPLQFRPERFLDADGKFQPDKNVMPFSVGKRQCMGESMARAELFLFLTCFVQAFTFHWPEGFTHDLGGDPAGSFLRNPKPYKLIPERR
ncbi:cytochrome P450 2D19-like [Pollicipes pollicipes]|uniref:cytochrome P450 2D19-like n=1 Tax=Pollicipes pollicipes TaxID=41117 RepID=UPI0018858DFD|nr:cytochrome P450 2D19-like [Pollicipes pollicipes]